MKIPQYHERVGVTWLKPSIDGYSWGELPVYAEREERSMKVEQHVYDLLEKAIMAAYELGHAHGMNVYRYGRGMELHRENEGWGAIMDAMVHDLQDEDSNARDPGRDSNDG